MKFAAFYLFSLILLSSELPGQPIYRVVDEQGRVTYTDQKPDDHSEPIELPDLTVIHDPDDVPALTPNRAVEDADRLRLMITEPVDGAEIRNPLGELTLHLESSIEIPPAALLIAFINDVPQEPMRQQYMRFSGLPDGRYRLRVELQTPSGRVLAVSETIQILLASESADSPTDSPP